MHILGYLIPMVLAVQPVPAAASDAGSRVSGPTLEVSSGGPVLVDGVFDDGEWDDAAVLPLGGVDLLAKRDAHYLYLALRFVDGKHSGLDLYLAGSPEVRRLFHISSELGTRRWEDGSWSDFAWDVRGWVGNPVGFNHDREAMVIYEPEGFELQLTHDLLAAEGLGGPGLHLAFLLKRPEFAVPEGAQEAPLPEWVELRLPGAATAGPASATEGEDAALRLARLLSSRELVMEIFGNVLPAGPPRELAFHLVKEDAELWNAMEEDLAATLRESFERDDIGALLAFFQSDLGRTWLDRSPQILARQLEGLAEEGSAMRRISGIGCALAIVGPNLTAALGAAGQGGEPLSPELLEAARPVLDEARSFCDCVLGKAAERWGADALANLQGSPELQALISDLIESGTCPLPNPGNLELPQPDDAGPTSRNPDPG